MIPAMWAAWIAYWLIAARGAKRTRWREPIGQQLVHGIPLTLCLILLAAPAWMPRALTARFIVSGPESPAIGTVLVAAGIVYAVRARIFLGDNWSGRVELKEGHSLVRSGPYRRVRHPIYTGLLLAVGGTALAIGEWRGLLALACALFGVLTRISAEERQMRLNFPEYEQYRRESAALIPFVL